MIYDKLVKINHLEVQINIKKWMKIPVEQDIPIKIPRGWLTEHPPRETPWFPGRTEEKQKKTIQIFSYFYTNYYYSWGQIFIGVLFHSARSCNRYVSGGGAGQTLSIKKTPTTRHRRIPFWNVPPLQPQKWQMLRLLYRRTREQPRLLSATRTEKKRPPLTPNIRRPKKKTVAH